MYCCSVFIKQMVDPGELMTGLFSLATKASTRQNCKSRYVLPPPLDFVDDVLI